MIQLHNFEQQTEEWFKTKSVHPLSGSEATAIGNQGKGLETLVWSKLAEKYSSNQEEGYTNKDLERGNELEPIARSIYALKTGKKATQTGFVTNSGYEYAGVSPDGLIDEDGLVEIKCFEDKKHFRMIVEGLEVDSSHEWQMQMQMLITERKWCDYVVYNPNYPTSLLIQRVLPDHEKQEKLKAGLLLGAKLIKEIETKWKKLA